MAWRRGTDPGGMLLVAVMAARCCQSLSVGAIYQCNLESFARIEAVALVDSRPKGLAKGWGGGRGVGDWPTWVNLGPFGMQKTRT